MAYDYNEYVRKYNKKNIKNVSLKLHRSNDADIIEALESSKESNQATIKKLIRKVISKDERSI